MSITIDLQIIDTKNPAPSQEQFQTWVDTALAEHGPAELTIRLVDKTESQELNLQFRGKDKPTNVLSFPFDHEEIELEVPLLGDLVICSEIVIAEAEEQKKSSDAHWAHLVIHGCLHLLGYDHQKDDEAVIMESRETVLLGHLGYKDPYHEKI